MDLEKSQKSLLKCGVFISGHGTNLQALIDSCASKTIPAKISFVLSNNPDAYGLKRAEAAQIPYLILNHKNFKTREEYDAALLNSIQNFNVDLICLAGFMRILSPVFIKKYEGRILNIHPSLLPKFKGLHTHKRAIEAKEIEHGCTVHLVTEELDDGEIIVQRKIKILENDTAQTLNNRVLAEEVIAYPEAITMMAKRILETD